jgi:hypothetical protein
MGLLITCILAGFSVIPVEHAAVIVAAAVAVIFVDTLYWQPRRLKRAAASRGYR